MIHKNGQLKKPKNRYLCPATCVAGAPPANTFCALDVQRHDISRLVIAACNYNFPTLPTSTPAAICTALAAANTAGQVFVTPPIVAELGAPSFTDYKASCNVSIPIEGARKLSFKSAAAWTVTGVAGATAPNYGHYTYWSQLLRNKLFVVRGYIGCDNNLYLFQKGGAFVDAPVFAWQETEAAGDVNILVTKGEITFPNSWDSFVQPQISITCNAALAAWLA